MPVTPLSKRTVPKEEVQLIAPCLPVIVAASFKGGVWKSSTAGSIAERLAWAGLRVLLIVADRQEDMKMRLGIAPSAAKVSQVKRGQGSITLVCARGPVVIDLLYRTGPSSLGQGDFHIAVVDTPPGIEGGLLPGALLIALTDGNNASTNLVTMLRQTPKNTEVVLVRVGKKATKEYIKEWASDVVTIATASKRKDAHFVPEPIPRSTQIDDALGEGLSVWSLPRHGNTLAFLNCIEMLSALGWQRVSQQPMPPMPSSNASAAFVRGWDDEDA